MIPLQLTLKNFLSYREATLDFRGLHTACICGANGAGKSSLLEAITWTIWGQSRAVSDDDVIHAGADYVRVDFQFISNHQAYRIIRSRHRGRSSSLEFQIESEGKLRSVTAKGVRATQEQIITYLKLDYDTFVNSAYLRQGRADEFMLRRPTDRKQILADLLKLDQYEILAARAKDLSKQYKGQGDQLELSLEPLKQQLARRLEIDAQKVDLVEQLQQLQLAQDQDKAILQQLQAREHQRQNWYQQYTWQQSQYQSLERDCDRLNPEILELNQQLSHLQTFIERETEITTRYQTLQQLQAEEKNLSAKFQAYQDAQQQRQQLEQQLLKKTNELQLRLRQTQTQLETLEQQEKELHQILNRSEEVKHALEQLRSCRQRLHELDKLQHKVAPLLQRRYALQTDIERAKATRIAKLEQLCHTQKQYSEKIAKIPQMRQDVLALDDQIQNLENKQNYQKRVEEKGQERKGFKERLKEHKRICEEQIGDLNQKLKLLESPEASCPLCKQNLDDHHRHQVIDKTQRQQQTIQEEIWMLSEQMSVCERELQILREEYTQLKKELSPYNTLQQKFGQLEAQLEAMSEVNSKLRLVKTDIEEIERSLATGNYAIELQSELNFLNQELQTLNYDEQTHALVRGEVERWRWAEIKQAKLEDAKRKQAEIAQKKPKLLELIRQLNQEIKQLQQNSDLQQKIDRYTYYLQELGYQSSHHQQLLSSLREAQSWQLSYQELQQAKQQYPRLQQRLATVQARRQDKINERQTIKQQLDSLSVQMEIMTDKSQDILELEEKILNRRQKLDYLLAQKGQIEQSLSQLADLQKQYDENCRKLQDVRRQFRIYKELTQAFGKNGIQALMIENILPQLEAQTNQILARLTSNQLHIQFVTQRPGRGGSSKRNASKLIDTLDILIADARGTRSYETYSGGEAFRINFSIRLALAKLLAQRSGASLQMLIVDEGFGTQDSEGCERLIAAINAIASDFACILTVTHMPQFKEAFAHRIEVRKTNYGSQLMLAS